MRAWDGCGVTRNCISARGDTKSSMRGAGLWGSLPNQAIWPDPSIYDFRTVSKRKGSGNSRLGMWQIYVSLWPLSCPIQYRGLIGYRQFCYVSAENTGTGPPNAFWSLLLGIPMSGEWYCMVLFIHTFMGSMSRRLLVRSSVSRARNMFHPGSHRVVWGLCTINVQNETSPDGKQPSFLTVKIRAIFNRKFGLNSKQPMYPS